MTGGFDRLIQIPHRRYFATLTASSTVHLRNRIVLQVFHADAIAVKTRHSEIDSSNLTSEIKNVEISLTYISYAQSEG